MPCRPDTHYTLPTQALRTPQSPRTSSGGHPCSHQPRNEEEYSEGTGPGRRRSAGRACAGLRVRRSAGADPGGHPESPVSSGVYGPGLQDATPPGKDRRGCASRRRAPILWRTSGGAPASQFPSSGAGSAASNPFLERHPATRTPGVAWAALTWRRARCRAPAGCGSPPASSAGSAHAPGAPCSPGDAGRKAGTLEAQAPSPHVPRHHRGDAGTRHPLQPLRLGQAGSGNGSFPAQVEAPPPARPAGASGDPAPAAAPGAPRLRQRPAPRRPGWGALKQPRPPPPSRPQGGSSLGNGLWPGTAGGMGKDTVSELRRNRRASWDLIWKLVTILPLTS